MCFRNMKPEGINPVEIVRETLSDSTSEEEARIEKRVYKELRHEKGEEVSKQVMH